MTEIPELRAVRKPPTLNDVAKLAGVSIGTVSKALNGKQGLRSETRKRVEAAADQLRFTPNPAAQALLAGKTGTVGLLTNDLEGRLSIPILMGAENALGIGRLSVFLCDARGDAIREQHHLRALLNRRVDGLIVVADTAAPRPSLGRDIPVPVVYAYGASDDSDDMSVVSDNISAGRIGIEHLLAAGRRRIAYIGGDSAFETATERADGAIATLAEHDLELITPPLFGPWAETWGRQAARLLLDRAPEMDAIFCGSDQIARGVMDGLRDVGKRVPRDVAVLGHDNWGIFAEQARPPLSTIDMNLEELGRIAAGFLFEAMDGQPQRGIHSVACRVVSRESTM